MSVTQLISVDDVAKLVPPVVSQAQQMTVASVEDYEMAGAFLQLIAKRRKQIEEVFDPIVAKAHAAWKEACNQRTKLLDPLEEAKKCVNEKLRVFDAEQDRRRRQEEARLSEEAKKKRDEDALKEAQALEASGEKELADVVMQMASEAPAPVVVLPSSTPKMSEMQARFNWKFRIVNESLIPREFLSPDEKKIGAVVRSLKAMAKIPGIEIYSEKDFHGRTA